MKSKFILYFISCFLLPMYNTSAQDFEYVPPIKTHYVNKDTNSLILGTIDYARFQRQSEKIPYINTLQIVNACQPWPPLWYMATPLITDKQFSIDTASHHIQYIHIGYPSIDSQGLSFLYLGTYKDTLEIHREQFEYYYVVLNKKMESIDTLQTRYILGGYTINHRQKLKTKKLLWDRIDSVLDLSNITHNKKDTAIKSDFWVIKVLDGHDSVLLYWNPLYYLSPELFDMNTQIDNYSLSGQSVRWRKINDAWWDYDDNIIYSFERGIGKISKQDGHIIWHFDCPNMAIISGEDSFKCFDPIQFFYIGQNDTCSYYSLYERGKDNVYNAKGVILEQDKKTYQFRIVRYVNPRRKYHPNGHSGFDYDLVTGNYEIDYGVFDDTLTNNGFWDAFEYGCNDSLYAVYELPKNNYSFGIQKFEKWPFPPRPIIVKDGDMLKAVGITDKFTWYQIENGDNINIKEIGKGEKIRPNKTSTYCVVSPYGVGYVVSKLFNMKAIQ